MKLCPILPLLVFGQILFNTPELHGQGLSTGDWQTMKNIRPRGYICTKATQSISIDGKLDENEWQNAKWTEDFVDIEGNLKPKPRQSTRVKMLWDDEYFYLAAELRENHLQATLTEHDSVIFQDNDFEVFIDPEGDNHHYLELELNALNTTWDLLLPRPYKDGGKADNGWEFAGMKTAVHLDGTLNNASDQDSFWSLEIAIPWTAFRAQIQKACPPNIGDLWRINFSRVEWQFQNIDGKYVKVPNTREDNWVWSPQGIIDMHRPERWGFVLFQQSNEESSAIAIDPDASIRDSLMEIYHRQRSFHQQNKRWAVSLNELEVDPSMPHALDIRLTTSNDGYLATVQIAKDNTARCWSVRQDSKLWSSLRIVEPSELKSEIRSSLDRAGDNREQLWMALENAPKEHLPSIEFLIENMPDRDLKSLSGQFLLENTRLAYDAWQNSPWRDSIPEDIYLNNILPYANINERRDHWRQDFKNRFEPLIREASSLSHAAALLNQKLFPTVNVKYSTQRAKADQSPMESMKSGLASCTGLSILLIDACRACGIPARFVGTPMWSDKSGNHSWVEVYDHGWHFTGACEPNGNELDKAWFTARAATAVRDSEMNAIYAVSFQKTPLKFPLVWDRKIDYIRAVNVTDRYTQMNAKPPEGTSLVMFRVSDANGKRVVADVKVLDSNHAMVFQGQSKDDRFDTNDHLFTFLPTNANFTAIVQSSEINVRERFQSETRNKPLDIVLRPGASTVPEANARPTDTLSSLNEYLSIAPDVRPGIDSKPMRNLPLTFEEAQRAIQMMWKDKADRIRNERAKEMELRQIVLGELTLKFDFTVFGSAPNTGHSLFISMHGGGNAPPRVNDQQWENQKKLYQLSEGIYVAPRAPTNTWDLWHQSHIDAFFDRLIENFIVFHGIDSERVYLMGYSAGGDGVYQLAPRMADRFAAASMMAGHPNETSPLGLRNLPFAIHMGEKDGAYNRNQVAKDWSTKLTELKSQDPDGYEHIVKLHEGKGHWMDRQDAEAIPWMSKFRRTTYPTRIVWKQDDVREDRFYWLAVPDKKELPDRAQVVATRSKQRFDILSSDTKKLILLLNDTMLNLDEPIEVYFRDKLIHRGMVKRTVQCIASSLDSRADPMACFSASLDLDLSESKE